MRTEKELLKLMLERQDQFAKGLCLWVTLLNWSGIITYDECCLLEEYIHNNRPSMFSSLSAFKNRRGYYYWNKGDITPRIKWINKQIEKL
jgi:hypothetical protein